MGILQGKVFLNVSNRCPPLYPTALHTQAVRLSPKHFNQFTNSHIFYETNITADISLKIHQISI
jgi:hypothetical protein